MEEPLFICVSAPGARPAVEPATLIGTVAAVCGPWSEAGDGAAVVSLGHSAARIPREGLFASPSARMLASSSGPLDVGTAVARGRLCIHWDVDPPSPVPEGLLASPLGVPLVLTVEPTRFGEVIADAQAHGRDPIAVIQADGATPDGLLPLIVRELHAQSVRVKVRRRRSGAIQTRRASAGLMPGGESEAWARRLIAHSHAPRRSGTGAG